MVGWLVARLGGWLVGRLVALLARLVAWGPRLISCSPTQLMISSLLLEGIPCSLGTLLARFVAFFSLLDSLTACSLAGLRFLAWVYLLAFACLLAFFCFSCWLASACLSTRSLACVSRLIACALAFAKDRLPTPSLACVFARSLAYALV